MLLRNMSISHTSCMSGILQHAPLVSSKNGISHTVSLETLQDLLRVIEAAGAQHVSLNPVTSTAMLKRISAVAAAERVALAPADAKALAESAAGDLRNALETLQLLCGGEAMKTALQAKKV